MKNELDDIVIEKVLQGNTSAYEYIVHRYQDKVYNLAFRLLGNQQDAEEVAQDSFVKAYRNLSKFHYNASFGTWIYRITYNTALTFLKKRALETSSLATIEEYQHPLSEDLPLSTLDKKERKRFLEEALSCLKEESRLLITLFYLQEKSVEEVAEITGMTKANVKVRIHRIRKQLQGHLMIILKGEEV
ncbi:RNA polymerase sigma factor [Algivirga pacifica]|uniref:RNA polymerase sigma factor n=1 Tax=Algivirga pacifica TaxID=1162670 RepID=A0ABP9DPB8_9BACT